MPRIQNTLLTGLLTLTAVTAHAAAPWLEDCSKAAIPNAPAVGKVHGKTFRPAGVELSLSQGDAGSEHDTYFFKLRSGKEFFADQEISINLITRKGGKLDGQQFVVGPEGAFKMAGTIKEPNGMSMPPVQGAHFSWMPPGKRLPESELLPKYTLKLEFGKTAGGKLPGKIYLCFPDVRGRHL